MLISDLEIFFLIYKRREISKGEWLGIIENIGMLSIVLKFR